MSAEKGQPLLEKWSVFCFLAIDVLRKARGGYGLLVFFCLTPNAKAV